MRQRRVSIDAVICGALLIVALALRIPPLLAGFWRDEGSTYAVVAAPSVHGVFVGISRSELTPPLYYLFEHFWIKAAGTSEIAMRLPSIAFTLLTVATLYAIGLNLGSRFTGVVAALLACVNPIFLTSGIEARAYGLTVLLSAAALYFFVRKRAVAVAVCGVALALTHFTGAVVVAVLCLFAGALALLERTPASRKLFAGTVVALAGAGILLPLFLRDASHFVGWRGRDTGHFMPFLDDHLNVFVPFGSMHSQTDYALKIGVGVWAFLLLLRRKFVESDFWIAMMAAIVAAGIAVSMIWHLPLERHLLAYAPAAWLLMALLLERCIGWLRRQESLCLLPWKIAVGLALLDIVGGGLLSYPRVFANTSRPASEAREFTRALLAETRGRATLLVALPDNVGPSLWYYVHGDPAITLRGVTTWIEPQFYGFNPAPWEQPAFAQREAARVDGLARKEHAEIALAVTTHGEYFNGVPFYRAHAVAEELERRHPVWFRATFHGWREPLELVILDSGRSLASGPHPAHWSADRSVVH